jgi:alanyl-tRNA synthetase
MLSSNEIRQQFLDFYQKHGHTIVPSSPVVPHDDPTLLFTNAGMNQFKDVFLGTGTRPYKRAADTQKCIRAGGKHNDLDDVGKDTYHHTFFEMLGNWSFGDYFKREAIRWAWELLTEVWKLDKGRLYVTVFEGDAEGGVPRDEEAATYWREEAGIDPKHIHYGNKKDNFWEMGDTGPCGPCTEIHYDKTPDKSGAKLVNAGTPDVIEIWNLVFIQYNRNPDRSLTPLPAKHVDTGMGFERVTAVLQGKASNYDTDVFTPIFKAIQEVTKAPKYGGRLDDLKDTAYRVIADHIRALTFALTDGATPSNVGRGYVLRSILRRAERYGWQQFGTKEPFLFLLVPAVVELMGGAFPELKKNPQKVIDLIQDEEKAFLKTLGRGVILFNEAALRAIGEEVGKKRGLSDFSFQKTTASEARARQGGALIGTKLTFEDSSNRLVSVDFPADREGQIEFIKRECAHTPVISGKDAFDLHTEQGVFIDITEQMANEFGLKVDRAEYQRLFDKFKEQSGEGRKKFAVTAVQGDLPKTDDSRKYDEYLLSARVLGWVKDNTVVRAGTMEVGERVALILDQTNFYAEQGGQVGDTGQITANGTRFEVEETQRAGGSVLHIGVLTAGRLVVGQEVGAVVDLRRMETMKNHTATHLLNFALRKVLGEHVEQKGSLVDAEKTRFDFSHDKPLTADEIRRVEEIVNEKIVANLPVMPEVMPLAEAKKLPGVRAVFGEKYPDPVRVLMIGAYSPAEATADMSIEFCGGTHLNSTGEAGLFKIVSQELVAKGIRRVTGVTGRVAIEYMQKMSAVLDELSARFTCRFDELPARVESLQEEVKKLQQQLKKGAATDLQSAGDKLLASAVEVNGSKVIAGEMPAAPEEQLRSQVDRLRQKAGSGVVVIGWNEEGNVGFIASVTDDLIAKGLHAGKLVGAVAEVAGGKGGGKPNMARAGGKDPSKIAAALQKGLELAKRQLSG